MPPEIASALYHRRTIVPEPPTTVNRTRKLQPTLMHHRRPQESTVGWPPILGKAKRMGKVSTFQEGKGF
ncbi:Nbs-lrr resistance protein [Corchorus olitorius]|uniref:Nbs-lrr resistance protein n=1 Tax=Corchorus olitorius TaxID=93759 RepID=A0A1R3GFH7_9ROSI|nr:Nbs-lrr resistance protein [Corchorus olitorius]